MNTTADPRSRSASGPERAASTSAAATPAGSAAPSAWGRSARLGGGTGRLVVVSLVFGVLLAAMLGVIAYGLAGTADPADPRRPWVLGLVVASGALPVLAGTVWMLLVDRATIKGAVRDPEESIESRWYDAAARGAFHDLLVVLGVGTFVVSMTGWTAELSLVGAGLLLFMVADVAIRYRVQKRRG